MGGWLRAKWNAYGHWNTLESDLGLSFTTQDGVSLSFPGWEVRVTAPLPAALAGEARETTHTERQAPANANGCCHG